VFSTVGDFLFSPPIFSEPAPHHTSFSILSCLCSDPIACLTCIALLLAYSAPYNSSTTRWRHCCSAQHPATPPTPGGAHPAPALCGSRLWTAETEGLRGGLARVRGLRRRAVRSAGRPTSGSGVWPASIVGGTRFAGTPADPRTLFSPTSWQRSSRGTHGRWSLCAAWLT
jgi:hypothetical protein